jgi:hypothetical protein
MKEKERTYHGWIYRVVSPGFKDQFWGEYVENEIRKKVDFGNSPGEAVEFFDKRVGKRVTLEVTPLGLRVFTPEPETTTVEPEIGPDGPIKDQSKLFEDVSEKTYVAVFNVLQLMRASHPSYRDDQLLMKVLCNEADGGPDRLLRHGVLPMREEVTA